MKRLCQVALGIVITLLLINKSAAITFTNDTVIHSFDTNYDGGDIVVSNCTLTVNGPHAFSNLLVTAGGTLTHGASGSSFIAVSRSFTNESQTLIDTNLVTLLNSGTLTAHTVTDLGQTIIYTNGLDYGLVFPGSNLIQLQRATNSTIPDGATVLVSYTVSVTTAVGLNLTVISNAEVAAGGTVNLAGRGFSGAAGFSFGRGGTSATSPASGGGAGHGGYGGLSSSNASGGNIYGSFEQPAIVGSFGGVGVTNGFGGSGGGLLRLDVGGSFILNGQVIADGSNATNSRSGGGSGGSVWISAHAISGAGSISANGGTGEPIHGGGGGGGRIAVYSDINSFTGTILARGAAGFLAGGPGTVYLKNNSAPSGQLVLNNGGLVGTNTLIQVTNNAGLTLTGRATALLTGTQTLESLLVASNSSILTPLLSSGTLNVSNNATIEAGAAIVADIRGSTGGTGQGAGTTVSFSGLFYGVGAGHGGFGALPAAGIAAPGNTYGSMLAPILAGSGGGTANTTNGGSGGGIVRMTVGGTLTLNGKVSANGGSGNTLRSGGGSGGSIWLIANTLAGSGSVSANGGAGDAGGGGGGGGGRIAIEFRTNVFTGTVTAFGAGGANWGGAGTIYMTNSGSLFGTIVLDNNDRFGAGTTFGTTSSWKSDLTVRRGVFLVWPTQGPYTIQNFSLGSNSLISFTNGFTGSLTMTNATIENGGVLSADAGASGSGPGFGPTGGLIGGGASFGGMGGKHPSITSIGGATYGSITQPNNQGSGGGSASGTNVGGIGGGAIILTVMKSLQLNGRVTASALNGVGTNSGGGSGGSVWISAETISGSGSITANGGNGAGTLGGGGGGGRIALYYATNTFSGLVSTFGGNGFARGGAGTLYTKQTGRNALLRVDNAGGVGSNTPISTISGTYDLTVKDGGNVLVTTTSLALSNLTVTGDSRVTLPSSLTSAWANLVLSSNAWLQGSTFSLTLSGNASIGAGCGIISDGTSSQTPVPNGLGYGASHAGYGGITSNTNGGGPNNPYGNITQPTSAGSVGNPFPTSNQSGGLGGGSVRLTVLGTLVLDGRISADGTNGFSSSPTTLVGGGSGGSVLLTPSTMTGSGLISASGGAGLNNGGGGGGGRIAVYPTVDLFTGHMVAMGGTGFMAGGAGTIYKRLLPQSASGTITVDNGGRSGATTVVNPPTGVEAMVVSRQGRATWTSGISVRQLQVRSNGFLIAGASLPTMQVSGDATIESGSGILADGRGFTSVTSPNGPGAGNSGTRGGAGHGGIGGGNLGFGGGGAYDSIQSPYQLGSGGGNNSSPIAYGGSGGGAIRLIVSGNLALDGDISSDGLAGGSGAGGGAGGSIWLTVGGLSGTGSMSVDGGAATGLGGGGGGGRISVGYGSNSFSGSFSAAGGNGLVRGGAGTIYVKDKAQSVGKLVVNNNGFPGTNTPISASFAMPSLPFDLTVEGGAVVHFPDALPVLSNLVVRTAGQITAIPSQANLEFGVLKNLTLIDGGAITVDGKGFPVQTGPGSGQGSSTDGSGGGYGGIGGMSGSGVPGGVTYGSATTPTDKGSGGGSGSGPFFGGSSGGGAIRVMVGGTALLDGILSANGDPGLQDNSGGGSGGSIWLLANTIIGGGSITADGGSGDFYSGGGGGGGRIALYSLLNNFTGSVTSVGGPGAVAGLGGSIFLTSNLPGFQVVSQFPTGTASNAVNYFQLQFDQPVDFSSVTPEDFIVVTPAGQLPASSLGVGVNYSTVTVSFPLHNLVGTYHIEAGPGIRDLLGEAMSQVYTGSFNVYLPTISGTVTDTNGAPVSGVLMQADGLMGATTDTNGNYAIGIPPVWSGTITPSLGSFLFAPGSRYYYFVASSFTNQNYLMVDSIAPTLTSGLQDTNIVIHWLGLPGVNYQPYTSTNLIDWDIYSGPVIGTNGPVELVIPVDSDPLRFFRVHAAN